ncbi:Fe-S cluster assembly sulfur transfer protein SufU [Facklamia hominis]|uniref:Fe-S cluster assembly sulfur transfer protein SufU n=1 Tax=Facklamia hominis TaxID=178214 RepID=UPI0038FC9CED
MALSRLEQLYRAVVLDHSSHPHHKGQLDHPTHTMELLNPSCGDMIQVQAKVVEGIIQDLAFEGYGCSISIASASMMCDLLIGQSIQDAISLVHDFNQLVGGQVDPDEAIKDDDTLNHNLQEASFLSGVKQFPARYKCAILSWRALEYGLKDNLDQEKLSRDGIVRKED